MIISQTFRIYLDKQFSFDIPIFIDESEKPYYYTGINSVQVINALDECVKKVQRKEDFVFSWTYGEDKTQFGTDRYEAFNLAWFPEKYKAVYSVATTMGFPLQYTMQQEQFLALLEVLREVAMQAGSDRRSNTHGPWKAEGDDYIDPYVEYFTPYVREFGYLRAVWIGIDFCFHLHQSLEWIPAQIISALDECVKKIERGEKFTFTWLTNRVTSKFSITFFPMEYAVFHKNLLPNDYEPSFDFSHRKRQDARLLSWNGTYPMTRFRFLLLIKVLRKMALSADSPQDRWNQEGDDYTEPYFMAILDNI